MSTAKQQELESHVIASVLQDDSGKFMPNYLSLGITGDMFSNADYAEIWKAMLTMFKDIGEVDEINMVRAVPERLFSEVLHLSGKNTTTMWEHTGKSLIDSHLKDNANRAAMYIQSEIIEGDTDAVISHAISMLEDRPASSKSDTSTKATILGLQDRINERKSMGSKIKTGITDIDQVVKIHGGQLITVAARPGGGKSTELIQMAFESACHHGASVDLYTLEMSTDEVLTKGLACMSGVSLNKIGGDFDLPADLQAKLDRTANKIAEANLHIYDDPDATTDNILAKSKQRQATTGLDAIFVDYVQIMNPTDPKAPRVEQVSQITRDLKKIAKRLNVPVIIAAQLNRDVAKAGRKPKLSDLRESGSIEQDSDVVLMFHPKKEVEEDPSAAFQVEVDMMVEKHRNGATFHCPCTFNKVESRFNNKTVGGM